MTFLSRVRGLWRFDGDEEPVRLTRRRFIFLGGVAAVGAALPAIPGVDGFTYSWHYLGHVDVPTVSATYATFFTATIEAHRHTIGHQFLEYRPAITILLDADRTAARNAGLLRYDLDLEKGTPAYYLARHRHKHRR